MKRVVFLLAALPLFAFADKSQLASRDWVRSLVGDNDTQGVTNFLLSGSMSVKFSDSLTNESCEAVMRVAIGSHPALKVVASTVDAIPAGTFYAFDSSSGEYKNCSNSLIRTIGCIPFTLETITTNNLGVVETNSTVQGNFYATDQTNGFWRMAVLEDTVLYLTGDRSKNITIRSTTLPERAAQCLIGTSLVSIAPPFNPLAFFIHTAYARSTESIYYTVNAETTIAVEEITFTRKTRNGKEVQYTVKPNGLKMVWCGPTEFETEAEANAAVFDFDNWKLSQSEPFVNEGETISFTMNDIENSNIGDQLVKVVEKKKTETKIETPGKPAHPCPAPSDYWVFDSAVWENTALSDAEAAEQCWKVNTAYNTTEKLNQWRGEHECKCGNPDCPNFDTSKHDYGRFKYVNGELVATYDESGGCKGCVRCVQYGNDEYATINECNDHQAAGEGAGYCGCACKAYTTSNVGEWPMDLHNHPAHTATYPSLDYSCMCYCSRANCKASYFQHTKCAGNAPWCDAICARCGMVEDTEKFVTPQWQAFPIRYVIMRDAKIDDHTPRSDAPSGITIVDYYTTCGCVCQKYDTSKGNVPSSLSAFHTYNGTTPTCTCSCGQGHKKNYISESETADPFPCPAICAVCKKVESTDNPTYMTVDGEKYLRLSLVNPDDPKYHTAMPGSSSACGCACYNGTANGASTKFAYSIGLGCVSCFDSVDGSQTPKFHRHADSAESCACTCGQVSASATGEPKYAWQLIHKIWATASECTKICKWCYKKLELGIDATEDDHDPKTDGCGCKCGYYTAATATSPDMHNGHNATWPCHCQCGNLHKYFYQKTACRFCNTCAKGPDDEDIGVESLHVLKTGATDDSGNHICRCDCGYYSSELSVTPDFSNTVQNVTAHLQSDTGNLHDWDTTTVNSLGVKNCRCYCKAKHQARIAKTYDINAHGDYICPAICMYCRKMTAGNIPATEKDHTRLPASSHLCGCKCRYYGAETGGTYDVKEVPKDPCLHNESCNAGGTLPNYCQCWGDGSGGNLHYCHERTDTCPRICAYRLNASDEPLGHLVSTVSGATDQNGIASVPPVAAEGADHAGKEYGCGCKCGLCDKDTNLSLWKNVLTLHHAAQNATDQCHCECGQHLVGPSETYGHVFTSGSCICTCGKSHRSNCLNACKKCVFLNNKTCSDGKERVIVTIGEDGTATMLESSSAVHLYNDDSTGPQCHCLCGEYEHPDGHVFQSSKCKCNCNLAGCSLTHYGDTTREHVLAANSYTDVNWFCPYCGACFTKRTITFNCARCGENFADNKVIYLGAHAEGCGHSNNPKPHTGCWKCGCTCSGSHSTCDGHYCTACCYPEPKTPRKPKTDPTPYTPPSPEYTNAVHTCSGVTSAVNSSYVCAMCNVTITVSGTITKCSICGKPMGSELTESSHGDHGGDISDVPTETDDGKCSNCGHDYHGETACTEDGCTCCHVTTPDGTSGGDGDPTGDGIYPVNPYLTGSNP